MKKLISLVLALIFTLSFSCPAAAVNAEDYYEDQCSVDTISDSSPWKLPGWASWAVETAIKWLVYTYVYNLPSFSIGDDLIITDTVQNMTYEPDADRTILEFNTRRGTAYWPFDGNLMNQIFVGDQISFSFNVVEQYTSGEHVFESLNYFQNAQAKLFDSSVKLDINNYLVK